MSRQRGPRPSRQLRTSPALRCEGPDLLNGRSPDLASRLHPARVPLRPFLRARASSMPDVRSFPSRSRRHRRKVAGDQVQAEQGAGRRLDRHPVDEWVLQPQRRSPSLQCMRDGRRPSANLTRSSRQTWMAAERVASWSWRHGDRSDGDHSGGPGHLPDSARADHQRARPRRGRQGHGNHDVARTGLRPVPEGATSGRPEPICAHRRPHCPGERRHVGRAIRSRRESQSTGAPSRSWSIRSGCTGTSSTAR